MHNFFDIKTINLDCKIKFDFSTSCFNASNLLINMLWRGLMFIPICNILGKSGLGMTPPATSSPERLSTNLAYKLSGS